MAMRQAYKGAHGAWIPDDIWTNPLGFERNTMNTTITRPSNPATEKQMAFLKKLFAERSANETAMAIRQGALQVYRDGALTSKGASQVIDAVLQIPADPKAPKAPQGGNAGQSWEEGDVLVGDDGETFLRVKRSKQTGKLYAMEWDGSEWNYAPGALYHRSLRKATAEDAARFGHTTSHCVFCGRELTDDGENRSIAVGYGPVCAEKYGLPWG